MADLPSAQTIATNLWPGAKREKPGTYNTRCPLHDDKRASLSITETDDGKILVRCHAGCDQTALYKAVVGPYLGNGHAEHVKPVPKKTRTRKPKDEVVAPVPPEAPPPPDHLVGVGKAADTWDYTDDLGRLMFRVARFATAQGKEIRPQRLVRRGGRLEWQWAALPAPRPLWGLPELLSRHDVLLVEGEKCARVARRYLSHRYAVTTWAGGANAIRQTDWQPLAGRRVIIWPDADAAGQKAAEAILEQFDPADRADMTVLPHPPKVAKGFDVADAVETWSVRRLEQHLDGIIPEDELVRPEEIVSCIPMGMTGGRFVYWSDVVHDVLFKSTAELGVETHLLTLAPLDELTRCFPTQDERRSYAVSSAREHFIGSAASRGVFDPASIRGRGVWRDGAGAVIHLGDRLLTGDQLGVVHQIGLHHGHAYIQAAPLSAEAAAATDAEARAVQALCDSLLWHEAIDGKLLAGWLAVAPLCGWLRWRPSIWISGQSGAGKSWVIEHIVHRLLGAFALKTVGGTTEAGIRQALGPDALPVVFDEAEGDNQAAADRVAKVMELARAASSDAGDLVKGTAGHAHIAFHIRTAFCFSSIGAQMTRAADTSRISLLELDVDHAGTNFPRVLRAAAAAGKVTPSGLVRRMVARLGHLEANIGTFGDAVVGLLGNSRDGQQLGTLLAGAYTLQHANDIAPAAALALVRKLGIETSQKRAEVTDQERCRDAIMSVQRRIDDGPARPITRTVHELVEVARGHAVDPIDGMDPQAARRDLARLGIRADGDWLIVHNRNDNLRRSLNGTPFAAGWSQYLGRLDGADNNGNSTVRIGGAALKVTRIPLDGGDDED